GKIPLWNPYLFSGVPFLAAGQYAVLYPLGIVFYLLPLPQAYGWFTALHLFLAGLFMYVYVRVIGLDRFAAAISAISFQFCSFLVVSFLWPMVLSTAVWTPLLLAIIELAIAGEEKGRGPRIIWPLVGAIVVGLQFLAGHMEISFYVLFTLLYYTVCRLGMLGARGRGSGAGEGRMALIASRLVSVARVGGMLAAMVALGVGIAGTQLVPFQEVIRENFRSGYATYQDVIGWALPRLQALSFVMPDFFGNPTHHSYFDLFELRTKLVGDNFLGKPTDPPHTIFWGTKNYVEAAAYVGILPLVLALVAMIGRRNRYTWIFASYAVFSLLLAFGSPLYAIFFYGIPGFDQLHTPFRWIFPYTISIAVLAGLGAAHLVSHRPVPRKGRGDAVIGGTALALGVGALLVLAGALLFREQALHVANALLVRSERLKEDFGSGQMLFSYEFRNFAIFGALLAASGAVILCSRTARLAQMWKYLAVLLLVGDLFFFGIGFNARSDPGLLKLVPPAVDFLRSDKELFRITSFGDEDVLKPNLAMTYGLQDIRGYDTIILKQYVGYWKLMEEPYGLLYSMIKTVARPDSLNSRLLDLMNVKYVLTTRSIDSPGYELAFVEGIRIYRNRRFLPRALLVGDVLGSSSSDDALARLAAAAFDPSREAVVEGWPSDDAGLKLPRGGGTELPPPTIVSYTGNQVIVEVDSPQDALLVLADTYFPGWHATVDGVEATIYKVNYNFRGVPVPAGKHTVSFKYSPLSFQVGLLASLVSIAVVVLGIAYVMASRFSRRRATATVQRVAKNSITPMATSLVSRVFDLAFAMLMLRMLGPANVGEYTFAVVVIGYFEIFTNFGLNTLLTREVSADSSKGNAYLSNTAILRLLLVLAAAPALAGFLFLWQASFGLSTATGLAILLLALSLVPGNIAAALSSVFYAYERMEYPAAITVVTAILKVSLGTLALLVGWSYVGLAAVSIVVNVLTAIILACLVWKVIARPKLEFDGGLTRSMLGASWPLMLNHLLATLFFRIDVMLLQSMRGATVVGYYSTAYKFIDGLNIIPSTFTMAVFPILSRYARSGGDSFVRAYVLSTRLLLIVSVPIAVSTTFLAEPIVMVFGGEQYLPHSVIALQVLIWFLPFSYVNSLTQYVLIAINQQRFIAVSFVIATSLNIVLNLVLIPHFSYVGAAAVTVLSELLLLTPFLYCVYRHLGHLPLAQLAWRPAVAGGLMAAIAARLQEVNVFLAVGIAGILYVVALVALGAFHADDLALVRNLVGKDTAQQVT
ncbi:MAG: oligosaccharide flippase family protein, partial [Chloroflexi bacterium]|nr:oligosaccharide flippase family protein [Chloroflexota bacterium]